MALAARFDYHRLRYLAPPLVLVALVLCVAVLVVGPPINGARRWFLARPGELPAVRAREARALPLRRDVPRAAPRAADVRRADASRSACSPRSSAALILLEPDLGTTITLCGMMLAIFLVAGVPVRLLVAASALAVGDRACSRSGSSRTAARASSASSIPWSDAQGAGFQIVQATIGIGSGGFTGAGLGEGVGKISYLPEAHTDMIFAVIGEELGLVGATLVIARLRASSRSPASGSRCAAAIRSASCSRRASPRSSAGRRRSTSPPCSGSLR